MSSKSLVTVLLLALAASPLACARGNTDTNANDDNGADDGMSEAAPSAEALSAGAANTAGFVNPPDMSDEDRQAILDKYSNIEHDGVRDELFEDAIIYYDTNYQRIRNKEWMVIVDFSLHSKYERFYLLDMGGGAMHKYVVAHGSGSDPSNTGYVQRVSNVEGSNESSVGFFVVGEQYSGVHGPSLRIDGLSTTDSNVRERAVVIHSATYVEDGNAKQGRSNGCFALSVEDKPGIIAKLHDGAILYAMK